MELLLFNAGLVMGIVLGFLGTVLVIDYKKGGRLR